MRDVYVLFLMILASQIIAQDFDGSQNMVTDLTNNQEWSANITALDSLKIENKYYPALCQHISVKRVNNDLLIDLCGKTINISFSPDIAVVSAATGNSITFKKKVVIPNVINDLEEDPIKGFQRNIYHDAYLLAKGTKEEKEMVVEIWGLTTSSNNYLKNIVSLQSSSGNQATSKPSGIMGFNATIIADGFAKFLVARVKKELAISFFKGLKSKMNDDTLRDVRALFASSHAILNTIDEKIYNYQTYLPAIKQSFEYDLELLPHQLSMLVKDDHSQISNYLKAQDPESRLYITTFLDIGNALKNHQHIGIALSKLPENSTAGSANAKFSGTLQTLNLFSEALRDTFTSSDKPYWINLDKINNLTGDLAFFNSFMGLVVEKSKKDNIQFDINTDLATLLDNMHENIDGLKEVISSYGVITQQINQLDLLQKVSKSKDQIRLDYLQYFNLGQNLIGLIEPINRIISQKIHPDKVVYILNLSNSIHGIAKGVATKQYSLSLLNTINLLTSINKENHLNVLLKVLNREGMFIAQIAEANNSDEVAAIIENFAAPVGSWRDKREAKWNVAFDSYVGFGGYYITNIEENITKVTVPTPIGVSITSPWNWFTIMGSVVDIGPMVAFRFLDDESNVPNTYLKEIIAPGVFTSFNLDKLSSKDLLLKFNVGYQQFPLLEKTTAAQNNVSLIQKSGWTASINVNIPIMTLYHDKAD